MQFSLDVFHYHFTQERLRTIAASLLLINGLLHLSQIPVFGTIANYAAVTGFVYLIVGILLLRHVHVAPWVGFVVSIIGAAMEIPEFYFVYPNPLAIINVLLNIITAAICGYLIINRR